MTCGNSTPFTMPSGTSGSPQSLGRFHRTSDRSLGSGCRSVLSSREAPVSRRSSCHTGANTTPHLRADRAVCKQSCDPPDIGASTPDVWVYGILETATLRERCMLVQTAALLPGRPVLVRRKHA